MVSFLEYLVFFQVVFLHRTTVNHFRIHFDMFFGILIFDSKWWFCKGYRLSMIAHFQNGLISWTFGLFPSGFLHRTSVNHSWNRFWHIFWNLNFWPNEGMGFRWWWIFKIISFLEYLVFLWSGVLYKTTVSHL